MAINAARLLSLSILSGAVAAAGALVATRIDAAALLGESRAVQVVRPVETPLGTLQSQYRRPGTIPFPKDNAYTPQKAALGKLLFFDTRLSAARVLSCASCHNPGYGWGDGQPKGVGHGMKALGRRSPSIINVAFSQTFMWDGRESSLEQQALGPVLADAEMNLPLDQLLNRLAGIAEYRALFQAAFPTEGITASTIGKAIATFERTVMSGRAPFDAWIEGDARAIADDAKRGFALFNGKANCARCHSEWNFTDDSFHDIGLADGDIGRGKLLPKIEKMQHAFKTPGLREITRRGPYMHDGSIATLEAVVEHYDRPAIERSSRSDLIKPLGLSAQEKADLVAFLGTLNSELDPTTIPALPR